MKPSASALLPPESIDFSTFKAACHKTVKFPY
jgi:hypothetical protein